MDRALAGRRRTRTEIARAQQKHTVGGTLASVETGHLGTQSYQGGSTFCGHRIAGREQSLHIDATDIQQRLVR
jgi:hypothetical protein